MRKTRLLYLVALLLMAVMGAKASGIAMTTADIGKVLCTDGSIYTTKSDVPSSKTAAAMIAYVDEQNKKGLAIAYENAYYIENASYYNDFQWADAPTAVEKWSADKAVTGATWKLPTIDEWRQMLTGCGSSQNFTGINAKLASAKCNELDGYYWSSSDYYAEVSSGTLHMAECVYSDGFSAMTTGGHAWVRACLTFDVEEPAQTIEGLKLTSADIGKFICPDGTIYDTWSLADKAGKEAIAMIAYVDKDNHKALGLSVANMSDANCKSWYEAKDKISSWAEKLPAGQKITNQYLSWELPTIQEWQQMFIGCGATGTLIDNPSSGVSTMSYSGLKTKVESGGTYFPIYDEYNYYYWSATPDEDDNFAWCLKFTNGTATFYSVMKSSSGMQIAVHPCLSIVVAGEVAPEPEPLTLSVTEANVGQVVCTDGSLYDTKYDAEYYGKTPAGMIASVDMAQQTGLAIALEDERENIDISFNWITASAKAATHTPAVSGTTWKLPSIDDWRDMLVGCGAIKEYDNDDELTYAEINAKLSDAGGSILSESFQYENNWYGGEYWSEKVDEDWGRYVQFNQNVAYLGFSQSLETYKYVRACFPFNVAVKKYPITIDSYYASYVQSNKTEAAEGETVGLTVTPPAGKYVNYISVSYYDNGTNSVIVSRSIYDENVWTFTMPAYPVTVDYVDFQDPPTACEYNGLYYTLDYIDRSAEVAPHPNHTYSGNISIPRFVLDNKGNTYFVTGIGSNAFAGYSNGEISSVTCGSGTGSDITVIRRDAFYNTTLQSLTLNKGLTTIEQYAFRESNMPVEIPTTVNNISTWAFKGFKGTHLSVKSGNATYDSREDCNAIIETANNTIVAGCITTTIPTTVTTIGTQAFDGVGLTTFTIPANITTLEYGAFANNPLTSITIPKTVVEMETNPFFGCNQLQSIVVEEGNPTFDSRDNCNAIINTDMNWLWTSCKNTVIPTSVTGIGTSAFAYRDDLNEYRVPKHIKTIADNAFSYSSLWNISIEDNNELYLYRMAFQSCNNLRTVKIGRGVKELTNDIFRGCTNLKSIYVNAPLVPKTVKETFEVDDAGNLITATVYVPATSLSTYKKANFWKDLDIQAATGVQGVSAKFGKIGTGSGSTSPARGMRQPAGEGVDLVTEEGTIWRATGAAQEAFSIGTYDGETCLQISTSQAVSLSNRTDMGFTISGAVRDIVVWAAGDMNKLTCEIIDIAENAENTTADQTETVEVDPNDADWNEYTFSFKSGKKYSKAMVKLTIEGQKQAYIYSIDIIQGGGDYVITDEESVTIKGIEYSNSLYAPEDEKDADATIDGKPVYLYTTCLPTAPEQEEGLKFYTLNSYADELLQFVEITGAPQANTPYLVAVSSDSEISMSIAESQSVTLKKEADGSKKVSSFKFVGTTTGLTNAEAATLQAYILQENNEWGVVTTDEYEAYIPPFRAFIVPVSNARPVLRGSFSSAQEEPSAIKGMLLTDRNGQTRYFDLGGRPMDKPTAKGIVITNGKKVLIKK